MNKDKKSEDANQPQKAGLMSDVIHDRDEWDCLINAQSPERAALLQELTRFAELCDYFERQQTRVPRDILDDMRGFENMCSQAKTTAFREINRRLMERLPNADTDIKSRM